MTVINRIQKQSVHFTVNAKVDSPLALQQQVSQWCSQTLIPLLEQQLEPYAATGDVLRIDRLVIELTANSAIPDGALAHCIATRVVQAIEQKKTTGNEGTVVITGRQRTWAALLFFLQQGYLPWWSTGNRNQFRNSVGDRVKQLSAQEIDLLKEVLSHGTAARRFVDTVPTEILPFLFSALTGKTVSAAEEMLAMVAHLASFAGSEGRRRQFLQLVTSRMAEQLAANRNGGLLSALASLSVFLSGRHGASQDVDEKARLVSLLAFEFAQCGVDREAATQALHHHTGFPIEEIERKLAQGGGVSSAGQEEGPVVSESRQKEKESLQETSFNEAFYVGNAGLVLLAPFLPRFFANLGITDGRRFNSKDLAVALLQWLATGDEEYAEFEIVLPKLLCGLQPGEPLQIIPSLPETYRQEGELLLQSVIGHWAILKSTSVEGLRQGFLQRQGKLSLQHDSWLLQVEQKGYDLLVKELPWTIHHVRLPWMKTLLRTEWV